MRAHWSGACSEIGLFLFRQRGTVENGGEGQTKREINVGLFVALVFVKKSIVT
jgi:hypothetical protein